MGIRVSIKSLRRDAPAWVFSWRPRRESSLHQGWALLLVGGGFALCLTSLHVRVAPPSPWAARKASVIQVADDAQGRALTLQAREGGPFPSRFDPAAWKGTAALEQTVLDAARWTPPPYLPVLRNLTGELFPSTLRLAAMGVPVLPGPTRLPGVAPSSVKLKLAPVLDPLSGIPAAAMPRELPPFEGVVDATMTAESWRFLLCLDAAGNVRECISLAGGNEAEPSPLQAWLRRVIFQPDPEQPSRWIAVGVNFTNQPADGPLPR